MKDKLGKNRKAMETFDSRVIQTNGEYYTKLYALKNTPKR